MSEMGLENCISSNPRDRNSTPLRFVCDLDVAIGQWQLYLRFQIRYRQLTVFYMFFLFYFLCFWICGLFTSKSQIIPSFVPPPWDPFFFLVQATVLSQLFCQIVRKAEIHQIQSGIYSINFFESTLPVTAIDACSRMQRKNRFKYLWISFQETEISAWPLSEGSKAFDTLATHHVALSAYSTCLLKYNRTRLHDVHLIPIFA